MSEVLSPVGSMEALYAALNSGADAVYFGSKRFSARQNAQNLDTEQIKKAVFECHKRGVKIYQAINTVYFDDEKDALLKELYEAAQNGVDALIIQDLGVLKTAQERIPEMPLHASTQMTIHTPSGALLAKKMGFKRVVVSRECSLKTIREIAKTGIETEVFVHGALCMSVSGQCYLSAMLGSRSANRGLCAGACRLPFSVPDKKGEQYALSLKDLCAYESLKELESAGVCSFKIEGRMKRPEYVAAATKECVSALKYGSCDTELLRKVFSRDGFTNGYITDTVGADMFGFRSKEDADAAKETFAKIREGYSSLYKRAEVSFDAVIRKNEKISLKITDNDGCEATVFTDSPSFATNRATESDIIVRQLKKLGDTVYSFKEASVTIDSGLFVGASEINALRRKATDELDQKRYLKNTKFKRFLPANASDTADAPFNKPKKSTLRIRAKKASQLKKIDISLTELISLPFSEIQKADIPKDKLCLELDRFTIDEKRCLDEIRLAQSFGITHFLAQNISHFELLRDLPDIGIHAGFGMNITNSDALKAVKDLGAKDAELSMEITGTKAQSLSAVIPTGLLVYGHLPLMLTRNCPIKAGVGCKGCKGFLIDRMKKRFFVSCKRDKGCFELLNGEPLYLFDKQRISASFETIMLTTESADEAGEIFSSYLESRPPKGEFTRGLYYRGIT